MGDGNQGDKEEGEVMLSPLDFANIEKRAEAETGSLLEVAPQEVLIFHRHFWLTYSSDYHNVSLVKCPWAEYILPWNQCCITMATL